ncbi:MAG: retroviral-like aspartic protease family protein [Myxococcales bacterium]|nr:retroviral-like aspartic protease family protein [Myxococcales bacterium]
MALGAPAGCLKIPPELPQEPDAMPAAPSTAAEVLDRFVTASGGEAALRALPARTIEARMIVRAQEGCDDPEAGCVAEDKVGSFLLRTTADGKLYRRTVLDDLVEEKGFDGEEGWQLAGDLLRIESPEEVELSKEDAVLHWYLDLEERGVQVTLVQPPRKEDSEGQVTVLDGVRWETAGAATSPKTMWFDRATGLLREEIVEDALETDEGEQVQRQTIVYDDYRDVGGIEVPHLVRVINELGDQKQVVEFVTQEVDHRPVEASVFARPELPAPAPAPDQRLAALQAATKAAADEPDDAASQVALARAAWEAAHFETAEKAARATLALDPAEPEALVLLARVLVLRGDTKEAADVLDKARSAGLRPEVLALEEAWIHYRRRDFAKLAKTLDAVGNPVLAGRYRSFVGKPLQTKAKGCVTTVPLVSGSPLAVVEIMVEDEPVNAILDTGASDLILSNSFAAARGISVRSLGAQAPRGTPSVGYGEAQALRIGDVTITNVPVDVFDDRAMAEMAGNDLPDVKAVLGLSMLSDLQVSLDVPAKTLELVQGGGRCKGDREARRTGEGLPFWQHETHFLYVMAELGDAEGLYLLNTGMRGADIAANLLAHGHAGLPIPPMRDDVAMGTVDAFTLGPLTLSGLESAVAYTDPQGQIRGFFERVKTSTGFREDGMIGLAPLATRRFTLDFDTRRIYFADAPPTAAAKEPEAPAKGEGKGKGKGTKAKAAE